MSEIERYRFVIANPRLLDDRLLADIKALSGDSLAADFPDRSNAERTFVVEQAAKARKDPNLAVGGLAFRRKQRFTRPLAVLAFDKDTQRMDGFLPTADNASSSRRLLRRAFDLNRKLHDPQYIAHRWLWFGTCAVSLEGRQSVANTNPDELNLVQGMILAGVHDRDARQPVNAYTYTQELLWQHGLARSGLARVEGSEHEVHAFGEEYPSVTESRMLNESVADVRLAIHDYDARGEETVKNNLLRPRTNQVDRSLIIAHTTM